MPADRPLTLLPSSAAALAAAEVGEEVEVRAAMEEPPVLETLDGRTVSLEWEVIECGPDGWSWAYRTEARLVKAGDPFPAPAAEGERVEVAMDGPVKRWDRVAVDWPGNRNHGRHGVVSTVAPTNGLGVRLDSPGKEVSDFSIFATSNLRHEPIPATVVSGPVPERWCEGCRGEGEHRATGGEDEFTVCPDCAGDPPFAWRLTLRRDGGGDE